MLIAALTTKNEDWIINKTLNILNKFCDKIVILDDSSEDNTEQICRSYDKVVWYVRKKREHIWDRKEAEGLNQLFNIAASYNPQYILMLDADEIPTPSFINFFENIDKSIDAWSIRMINLTPDDNHYRIDQYITPMGATQQHNPFNGSGWRKTVLIKYDNTFNYIYNINIQKGGTSKYHPAPANLKNVKLTEEFYCIHYGKLNPKYISGEKDKFYALIESKNGKGAYNDRLNHHYLCRTGSGSDGPKYKECPCEWFWE